MAPVIPRSVEAMGRVIQVFKTQTAFAEALGVSQSTVSDMAAGIKPIPAERCPEIEELTRQRGQVVPCEQLRPDIKWSVIRNNPLEWV